jgi:hypothetical protein
VTYFGLSWHLISLLKLHFLYYFSHIFFFTFFLHFSNYLHHCLFFAFWKSLNKVPFFSQRLCIKVPFSEVVPCPFEILARTLQANKDVNKVHWTALSIFLQIWTRKYVYIWNITCTWSDTIRPCQNIHRNAPGGQVKARSREDHGASPSLWKELISLRLRFRRNFLSVLHLNLVSSPIKGILEIFYLTTRCIKEGLAPWSSLDLAFPLLCFEYTHRTLPLLHLVPKYSLFLVYLEIQWIVVKQHRVIFITFATCHAIQTLYIYSNVKLMQFSLSLAWNHLKIYMERHCLRPFLYLVHSGIVWQLCSLNGFLAITT